MDRQLQSASELRNDVKANMRKDKADLKADMTKDKAEPNNHLTISERQI